LQAGPALPLVIPSAQCSYFWGCSGSPTNRYNSSLSSTYRSTGDELSQVYNALWYRGRGSKDNIAIDGTVIRALEFLEWTEHYKTGFGVFNFEYDGIVSLTPPWYNTRGPPSLLALLDAQGELEANMFSLDLATTQNETGKLVVGAKDDRIDRDTTPKLPIVDPSNTRFAGLWTTPIKSISIHFKSEDPIQLPLPGNYSALLDPGSFRSSFPRGYGSLLLKLVGARRVQWINSIDCGPFETLPNITFTFEHNQTVEITPHAYALRMELAKEPYVELCTIAVDEGGEHGTPKDMVVLGSSFLRVFTSIWDWENKVVGCK
jgi:hypothetical protein